MKVWDCGCYAFGFKREIVAIRGGIGWLSSRLAVYQTLSVEYPSFYLFLACGLCYFFYFVVLLPCFRWRFVDVQDSDIFLSSRHVPDWQPRI